MKTAGDYLFVTDCEHRVEGEVNTGAVFVYKRNAESGAWELSVTLEGDANAKFGEGFDAKDAYEDLPLRFAVGAPGAGLNGVSAGGAEKGSP
jgi:hypothetical protein